MSRPDWLPSSRVLVGLHVYETTQYQVDVYPGEDRVTVAAEGSGGSVTLFLTRSEIARLRGVLERAERDLTARQHDDNGVRAASGPAA